MKVESNLAVAMQLQGRLQKRVFCIAGTSGSGKTTLMEKLIPLFRQQGLLVSAIKHAHSGFDMDRPGKDSHRIRDAGAGEVFLIGDKRSALLREYHEQPEPSLAEAVAQLSACDLILVEGFKHSSAPKIEVFRPSNGKAPLWPYEKSIVAVASDEAVDCDLPLFHLDDVAVIAQFISKTVIFQV